MKTNPILDEVRRVKNQLAADSGFDVDRFFEQLNAWSAAHPCPGPLIRNADELREYLANREREAGKESATLLNDKPAKTS